MTPEYIRKKYVRSKLKQRCRLLLWIICHLPQIVLVLAPLTIIWFAAIIIKDFFERVESFIAFVSKGTLNLLPFYWSKPNFYLDVYNKAGKPRSRVRRAIRTGKK